MVGGLILGIQSKQGQLNAAAATMNATFDGIGNGVGVQAKIDTGIKGAQVQAAYQNGQFKFQGSAQTNGDQPIIGELSLTVPQGVTAEQQANEIMFAVRRSGKGVYA